jgi:phage anti-repressor protein
MELSHELALALVQATDPFPVDFDDAWQWIGYSSKQKAKTKLINNFEEGIDFLTGWVKSPQGGRPSESIQLSVECLKAFGMMAGTAKGKEIRRYFLECEQLAKEAARIIPAQAQELEKLKLQLALAQTQERLITAADMLGRINPALPILVLSPQNVQVIERVEEVPTTVTVDESGQPVAKYDGVSITQLAKRYGFGTGRKATERCKAWLKSIGVEDSAWVEEPTAHLTRKLPRELMSYLDQQFAGKAGSRQQLIGEG